MMVKIRVGVTSSPGNVRDLNEDNFLMNKKYLSQEQLKRIRKYGKALSVPSLFAVCDGMGGIGHGEIASSIVVKTFSEQISSISNDYKHMESEFTQIIQSCNDAVCKEIGNIGKMGSTLAALYITEQGICSMNVGDSRIYQLREKELQQISIDHNQKRELIDSGMLDEQLIIRHKPSTRLTQFIGIPPTELVIEPYYRWIDYSVKRITYLICTDGVHEKLSDEKIKSILLQYGNPKKASYKLVENAMRQGSLDNVTALVLEVVLKGK